MKILHIVAGELSGGAARGAYWLHQGLRELGVDSKILNNSQTIYNDNNVVAIIKSDKDKFINILRKADRCLFLPYKRRQKRIFNTGLTGFDFIKAKEYQEADIIHLHWICGFVNIKHLRKINKPVIWTLRDMWPMTGGCHTPIECKGYETGCGNCMQLHSNRKNDLSRFILKRKIKYIPKNMKVIGISNWISDNAKKSKIFSAFDIRTIFNNININEFFPVDKNIARNILGIKTEKKIILIGAITNDYYKGFDKFIEAMRYLDKSKYFLCIFGGLSKNIIESLDFEYRNFNFLYDNISIRLIYNCADVFVAPSLMEPFGKTLAESMACSIPVVCFDATGPKDIVSHKIDGYKAKPFESMDLANGIEWVLNDSNYDELCRNAKEKVLREFDSTIIAKKYIELYKSLLN
jgi:glycosyltransferase involved in cell wall biosynthesis